MRGAPRCRRENSDHHKRASEGADRGHAVPENKLTALREAAPSQTRRVVNDSPSRAQTSSRKNQNGISSSMSLPPRPPPPPAATRRCWPPPPPNEPPDEPKS